MFGKLTFIPASGGKRVEHLVSHRLTYVGRDKDCSIRLEDPSVDGKQFVIGCSNQAKIQNLSRKLPTQVNQKSIGLREDHDLRDKDTISFGNKQFVWTMSASSGKRDPPRHDCFKGKRVSEPVRKVAVVTPNRRELPCEEDWVCLPPEAKRRRTMVDPSAATPEPSSFSRRVRYDRQLKQKMATPNKRKQSVGRTPNPHSAKKKSASFSQTSGSPQLTYDHDAVFNRSITPGRFYRRNDGPFQFRGFNPVPEEPISPGLLSGCDSFLSMDDSQMTRRSARVSTPYPKKSTRGSSQLNKTCQSPGPSGMYFPSIKEENNHRNHDATPSSYFSSTSGSPRMMRAESPSIVPGGSPFQGRRSLVQSSRSSSYGTPQDQSLHSHNDSLYANASGSSQMRLQDFEGSSMNQSRYNWTTEGMSSPRPESLTKTPPYMRTPRRSRVPIESPGSAAFSPNPSEANTSGYVLLSPRGKSIINRAFNRNDMSLQLSPQHSPARRLFGFSPRTDNRRHVELAQPLSVQVLTKSLKKKLDRTALVVNSPHYSVGTPGAGERGRTPKNSEALVETPTTSEPPLNVTPKSTRSTGSKRTALHQSIEPDLSRASRNSDSILPVATTPVGASKRKSSIRADDDRPLKNITPTWTLSRLSGRSADLSTPFVATGGEPKKSVNRASANKKKSVVDKSVSPQNATTWQSRSSKRSVGLSPQQSSELVVSKALTKSFNVDCSPVSASHRRSSMKGEVCSTPQPKLARGSLGAAPRRSSELDLSRVSRKSNDHRKSIPTTAVEVPYSEAKRSNKATPNSERTGRIIGKNEQGDSPSLRATTRLSKHSVGATPPQSSEPDLSRSSRKSGLRNSVLHTTTDGASKDEAKRSSKSTPKSTPTRYSRKRDAESLSGEALPRVSRSSARLSKSPQQSSGADSSRSYGKSSDLNSSISTSTVTAPSPPIRSNTFTLDSPDEVEKQRTSEIRASSSVDLSPDKVTPPGTSVEVNLRSSRKLSTKKKDSPSTPLTAGKVVSKLLSHKRKLAKSLSEDSMVNASPKSSLRNSLPASLERFSRGTSLVHEKPQAKRSGTRSASPAKPKVKTPISNRSSRVSLVGEAAQPLHLSGSPIPEIRMIAPTPPTRSAGATLASGGPVLGRRSSRRSGKPSVLSLPSGVRRTSVGKRSSPNSETPEACGSVGPQLPKTSASSSTKSRRSSQRSSPGEPAAVLDVVSTSDSPRSSRSSSESEALVTPPRSVEPEVVMRSSRKTPRFQDETRVPSTPTSAIRRNARRSAKRSPVPSVQKKLSLPSPRKGSVVKKLSLDPEKPDKNKMAALIACHKKKSPAKEQRPSSSCSEESTLPWKNAPENLTPLKDLDGHPEERSPEDALLDALDLSRKSAVVAEPKRPSRRLRSSANRRISAQSSAQTSSKSSLPSPPKSVKKLLFKTPLVEYEGSRPRDETSPSRSLKGILMASTTTASEEPMSRVFTTSPVMDFTDASGRKKIFRASPNSKSKGGGIHELVPDEESDLNIWTLFEASSSASGSSGRKRRGCESTDTTSPPEKVNTSQYLESVGPPQSTKRKRAAAAEDDVAVLSGKRSRKVAGESAKKASSVKSARKATTSKLASPKSTRRNLQKQFEHSFESPKSSAGRVSHQPSTSKASSQKGSIKQVGRAGTKANTASKSQATKNAPVKSKAGGVKALKMARVESPVKTRHAAAKSPAKAAPKRLPRAGKAGKPVQQPKTEPSKAKPKKAVLPAKARAQLKVSGSKAPKSSSPAKPSKNVAPAKGQPKSSKASKSSTPPPSPAKTRRRAVEKSPKKALQAAKGQPKAAGRKAAASSPTKSPPKTRKAAAVKSQKKVIPKAPPKTRNPSKSPPKAGTTKKKLAQKVPPKTGKPANGLLKAITSRAKSPAKASTSKAKPKKVSAPSPWKISPKKTRGKVVSSKAEAPKPAQLAKPKASQGAKPKTAQKARPKLSVPPQPLKGKAVGAKTPKKSLSPKNSPVRTRSRKPAVPSTVKSSRGKR